MDAKEGSSSVPPRTTSKPLISVTVQSSTESAQDVYLDHQDRGSEANSQSGRSNSSDSLCSIRTHGNLAKGPGLPQSLSLLQPLPPLQALSILSQPPETSLLPPPPPAVSPLPPLPHLPSPKMTP
ncbi:hypothetical protein F7725_000979 [Dissostichus mawsoni]|uniref:Uncharacterized protein n=1 Tax=Dissostichus mawsoni TaxID=36200 RepID=A0A7J5ZFY1_DISMA|nr:hypothetical protein F7725_000979 [Dissostichus mawsoni]